MAVTLREYSSIVEAIAKHSIDIPDKLCMADSKNELTYSDAWQLICGFAAKLKEEGVIRGDCVIIECNQSVEYMICEFAIQLVGAIFVPLEKNVANTRAVEIAGETGAKLHISNKPTTAIENIKHLEMKEALTARKDVSVEDAELPQSCDVAEILFSTGTTGKSKGIVLTHRNDVALAENVKYGTEMKENNVELIPMPISHSHGLRRTYGNMLNGSSVVYIDGVMFLKNMFALMDKYHVTAMDLSPALLSIIFKLGKDSLGDYADVLDYIQLGSAPLGEEDKLHLCRILPKTRLYNFYGSTEAGCSCILDFNTCSGRSGCIGKPTVNAEFIVVDEKRNVIQSTFDNPGLLASSGDINMMEYYNEPELTAETMQNGYIYTKDLGYIDEDGYVYMLGRKDDVINFGGIKISPEEIESIVMENPMIRDCALIGKKDAIVGQVPKLFIVIDPDHEYDAKAFKKFLMTEVDANKQPSIIEIIDEIPRTYNGKIIRRELVDR